MKPSTEPVILASLARVISAAVVGLGARYGLKLDPLEVFGLIVAAEMAAATWVRSRVSPATPKPGPA